MSGIQWQYIFQSGVMALDSLPYVLKGIMFWNRVHQHG